MRPRILVVDDDPLVLKAVGRMLCAVAEVGLASGVAEATEKLGASLYDVVLTDDTMPDGPGRAFLAIVRNRYPSYRRLLMSGDYIPSDSDLDPAYEYFVRKPFTAAAIIALLFPIA